MSNLIRGISENGGVVFCGVDSTEIVRKAEKLHTTRDTCSAALGRMLTGSSPAPTHTAASKAASTIRWSSFPQRRTAIWTWAAQSAKTAF